MKLKDKIKEEAGFQYVVEGLELMSSVGRKKLLEQEMDIYPAPIEAELNRIALAVDIIKDEKNKKPLMDLQHQLMRLTNIEGTINHLEHRTVLDEIELYEIKNLSYLTINVNRAAEKMGLAATLSIPDMQDIFDLLDPDHTRIANFYIYDSYHPELGLLRKKLKGLQTKLEVHQSEMSEDEIAQLNTEINEVFTQQTAIEQEVIVHLSDELFKYHKRVAKAIDRMGYADVLLAKATQVIEWGLCRPNVYGKSTKYKQLFNPRLKHRNESQDLRYQPIDVEVHSGLTLITGANMAGKTVVLKTLGISQLMAQYEMFVPAESADIVILDDVLFCIGDEQNEMNGLSSFASEIIKISDALRRTEKEDMLVLIDEPARTTNPIEGKAIVQAVGSLLNERKSISLITTHYSQLGIGCRRLRVKGFMEEMVDAPLTPQNINRFMDYALVEDENEDVPQEALRIATILGCDEEMIRKAKEFASK